MTDGLVLKPEDSADPQALAIELMGLLRSMEADALQLRDLFARWDGDPGGTRRKAAGRAHEIHEEAARALDAGEALMHSIRAARLFSVAYSDVGVSGDA
jgi:hypothetical protein